MSLHLTRVRARLLSVIADVEESSLQVDTTTPVGMPTPDELADLEVLVLERVGTGRPALVYVNAMDEVWEYPGGPGDPPVPWPHDLVKRDRLRLRDPDVHAQLHETTIQRRTPSP